MGKKVHPILIRLGISSEWRAHWTARPRDYAKRVQIDLLVRSYLEKELRSAGVSTIFVAFTNKGVVDDENNTAQGLANITARVARPGIVIGKKGGAVERMKKELQTMINMPVYLTIQEVRKPELDAKLIGENIASQLVRRINHRRAIKRAEDTAMNMGALGIKVIVSGRLGGTEIARRETYLKGSVPLHTFSKSIDYAQSTAQTSSGKIGIIVYVHHKANDQKDSAEVSNKIESNSRRNRSERDRSFHGANRRHHKERSQ